MTAHTCGDSDLDPGDCQACREDRPVSSSARRKAAVLGEGRHYGEWWGSGIQRGYGLPRGEKRFSLFNVARWDERFRDPLKYPTPRPECCHVVPVLHACTFETCVFDTAHVDRAVEDLRREGSIAAPGFMKPEGVVIWLEAARILFKKTIERDEEPKGLAR